MSIGQTVLRHSDFTAFKMAAIRHLIFVSRVWTTHEES